MCGIAGIVSTPAEGAVPPRLVNSMIGALHHRGPDQVGFYETASAALGIARLSIIDLTTGNQPVPNEDKTCWVVQNGEVYNFQELRQELSALGHVFASRSDTEVMVHGYEQWGSGLPERLRGMFAFAVWDACRHTLLLARDRLGEKPLYYATLGQRLAFASEIKALRPVADISWEVDLDALGEFFSFGYISAPRTIFKNVRKLEPGMALQWENGTTRLWRYWAPPTQALRSAPSFEEAKAQVLALLEDSVRSQMVSDAPLGAFLSGGLDSSVLVALMSKVSERRLRTFCVGFEEASFDERAAARAVAEHLGTEHEDCVLRPNVASMLPDLVRHFDEPFADKSLLPTYLVSKMARAHVKVAISGDGGDEVFGGYRSYVAALADQERERRQSPFVNLALRTAARACPTGLPGSFRLRKRGSSARKRFVARGLLLDPALASQVLSRDLLAAGLLRDPLSPKGEHLDQASEHDFLGSLQYADLRHYLPGDILAKVDRMTMKASLESRAPLLDHRLVEYVLPLPDSYKISAGKTKLLLRALAADLLPPGILEREKHGFALPVSAWLAKDLRELCSDVLLGRAMRETGWFRRKGLERLVDEQRASRRGVDHQRWLLMCLGLWLSR